MPTRRKLLSQVFLKDPKLVALLLGRSSIGKADLVLEVGAGTGIITGQLLKRARKVIAVEKDRELYGQSVKKYKGEKRLELHCADILKFKLPDEDYKVFANIPFAIEGVLVRRLINAESPPLDTYLIMRKEVAERMAGIPRESQFSILHKPWFDLSIFHRFRRDDFKPKPKVESVMLRITKREKPLIAQPQAEAYEKFIKQGFGGGRRIKQNLRKFFNKEQLARIAQQNAFSSNAKPSEVSLEQWVGMFKQAFELLAP